MGGLREEVARRIFLLQCEILPHHIVEKLLGEAEIRSVPLLPFVEEVHHGRAVCVDASVAFVVVVGSLHHCLTWRKKIEWFPLNQ